jgi:outer membrane receptor protein involved in Fe transport
MRNSICAAFVLVLASGFSPVWSQNAISGGAISGRIADSSGGVISGANVVLKNADTGLEISQKTNTVGIYSFPALAVGAYTLTVSQPGFKTTEVNNVIVEVGRGTPVDLVLQVGSLTESVTVTATAPLLQTTESSVSTVVDQTLIADLPLSGRRYTDFVLLTPNVTADGDFGLVSIGGQQGGGDSGYANGNGSNSFTLDGANASSNFFGDARGRTRVPYVFGEQSIQEFQVADSPYSAAYGGAGTGFINTVTKSGTDMLHGDAFYYNRNSGTGSNDFIDKAAGRKTPLNVLQQFGADLGGAILQHRLWFYFDYEQQRQLEPISVINSGYSSVTGTSFQNVAAGTALPAPNGLFPVPSSFDTAPLPTDPNYPTYLQQVSNAINAFQSNLGTRARRRDDLSFFPKVDWQLGPSDHVTFAYNYNRFNSPGGTFTFNPVSTFGVTALPNNYVRDHHATIHYTHTFANNLLNDLHISYLRDEQKGTPSGLIDATLPTVNEIINGFFSLGNPTFALTDTKEYQWELGEQLNWVHGRHNWKFGIDFNRTHVTDFFPGNFQGTYDFFSGPGAFPDFTNFALGHYGFYTQASGNPFFLFSVPYYGFYAQDKFQVRKNLTLDFGVREDFQVYPQPAGNPAFPLTGQFPNQYTRFSPRLGFAYQRLNKTVIRGGFGMFYEQFNAINYENSVVANGLSTHQATTFVPFDKTMAPNAQVVVFPGVLSGGSFSANSNISLVSPSFKTPYILESNLEIQRELFANTTLTVGTMWTHGVHLIASSAYDRNLNPPTGTTTYTVCQTTATCNGPTFVAPNLDAGLLTEGLINPNFGQINALISPGLNHYNSLYVQLQRRVSNGLSLQGAYTFSKNIQMHGVDFNNQFDFSNTHGPSLLDQRQRISIAAVYSPGASHLKTQFARTLLSNWTLSTVIQFNSGRPYTGLLTAGSGGNTVNDSAANQSTSNTAAGIVGSGPTPGQGFNKFYGPSIQEVDLGISRDFHLTERNVITLKAQAFNLFNHSNFFVQTGSGINQNQYDPTGANCGDGTSLNQTCQLLPDPSFKTLQSISELHGPRIFQFAFAWRF